MGYPSDIAFTPTVKAFQARRGSRKAYARMESTRGWSTAISDDLARFLSAATSVYIGTTNSDMQPYIQHRGGPPGFIRVLDEARFGFADFRGNRQYITAGNLKDNPRAFLFVMDYTTRTRVKIWGDAPASSDGIRSGRIVSFLMATMHAPNRPSSSPSPPGTRTAISTFHNCCRLMTWPRQSPAMKLRSRHCSSSWPA